MVLLAYRAILAEPRTKATVTEDYTAGAARSDYVGAADSMNQYTFPMGMQLLDTLIHCFLLSFMFEFSASIPVLCLCCHMAVGKTFWSLFKCISIIIT